MKVSVCIPTYNQAAYIEQAVLSSFRQSMPPFEIIVYDDCSTDETPQILERLSKEVPTLKIIKQAVNSGIAKNVDACLRAANGEFIVRLDSDDALCPEYIEKLSDLLVKNENAAYAHASVREMDKEGKLHLQRRLARSSGYQDEDNALKSMAKGFRVCANILMFRKSALEKIGYVQSRTNFGEDSYMVVSLAVSGYGNVYLDEILSYYRVWKDTGKVRQRRKIEEIKGYQKIFEEILEPAFQNHGWDVSVLKQRRADFACIHSVCLSWNIYTPEEKKQLKNELLKLSVSSRAKAFYWMYSHGFGKILTSYENLKIYAKTSVKSFLFLNRR